MLHVYGPPNLFELVIQLQERNLLEKAIAMPQSKGDQAVMAALRRMVTHTKLKNIANLREIANNC